LLDFLKILEKDASFDVLSPNDPGPFVYEAVSYLRAMAAGK
jgi:hypothetical protein